MPHSNNLSNFSNLFDFYDPLSLLGHALRNPQSFLDGNHANTRHTTHSPDFDLRETAKAYFLEGEFAGIRNRDAIKLQWLDLRTLRVEGVVDKMNLEQEWNSPAGQSVGESGSRHGTGMEQSEENVPVKCQHCEVNGHGHDHDHGEETMGSRSWLHERRTGTFIRTFNFPTAVDQDGIQARLSQGLLRILVPKANKSHLKGKDIKIDDVDGNDGRQASGHDHSLA
jgi:HSP20 family molecular chaperone IbpA